MTLPVIDASQAEPRVAPFAVQFGAAARRGVAQSHAAGLDLDDPQGAGIAFASIADEVNGLPLPGHGDTLARFAALSAISCVDVTLGRLVEAHADAAAILAELADRPENDSRGQRWGVWAAEGPQSTLYAAPVAAGYELTGAKPWCSGASLCTHALVTADGPAGRGMYAVELDQEQVRPQRGTWRAVGLEGSDTTLVDFVRARAVMVGAPGAYLSRRGFWHGAIGVAAVWWGAATGIAGLLYAKQGLNPHALAHLGAIEAALAGSGALLQSAAATIDAAPAAVDERLALTVRAAVEAAAGEVMDRVGRALGPAPLCQDRAHARRVADLSIYLRQSHAERDLEQIGRLAAGAPQLGGL